MHRMDGAPEWCGRRTSEVSCKSRNCSEPSLLEAVLDDAPDDAQRTHRTWRLHKAVRILYLFSTMPPCNTESKVPYPAGTARGKISTMESKANLISYALSICDTQTYRDHCRELTLCTAVDATRCSYSGNNLIIFTFFSSSSPPLFQLSQYISFCGTDQFIAVFHHLCVSLSSNSR